MEEKCCIGNRKEFVMGFSDIVKLLDLLTEPKVLYGYSIAITLFCTYLIRRNSKIQDVLDKISDQIKEDNQRYINVLGKLERSMALVLENSRLVTSKMTDIKTGGNGASDSFRSSPGNDEGSNLSKGRDHE